MNERRLKMEIGQTNFKLFTRWWIKCRELKSEGNFQVHEFYVPWYAWPLELVHRMIFGSTKIEKGIKNDTTVPNN